MASESPFDRLGAAAASEREPRRRSVTGRETIFALAHQELGEWRDWREIAALNRLEDPTIPRGDVLEGEQPLRRDFPVDGAALVQEENVSTDLGLYLDLVWGSPELEGEGEIIVTDEVAGGHTIAFRAPGDDVAGDPVSLTEEDASGGPRVLLYSDGDRYALDLALTPSTWLLLWLGRCAPLRFARTISESILIPTTLEAT